MSLLWSSRRLSRWTRRLHRKKIIYVWNLTRSIANTTVDGANDITSSPVGVGTKDNEPNNSQTFGRKLFESVSTTAASLAILGLAGYSYHHYYKKIVLKKIDNAFKPGDPVLELSGKAWESETSQRDQLKEHWILRQEQIVVNAIIDGSAQGHYYLLLGEKGTGKTSMLLDAMKKIEGDRCSMFEAHPDPEIVRIRMGKAIDFEFHEDYIGSLFSFQGPRQTTALLDIERAFNKLEKVAYARRQKARQGGITKQRPLVLIINSIHMLADDKDGQDLLNLIQQRAESFAASGLCTMILNSDDYWVWERLKPNATGRMEVLTIRDLSREDSLSALRRYRQRYFPQEDTTMDTLHQVFDLVGGRLTFLDRAAKAEDMIQRCEEINQIEKHWLLSQCGLLGEEMDDDVMDQQKYASSAMLLVQALVQQQQDLGLRDNLPQVSLNTARQIMTRADFIKDYDHANIFTIDSKGLVRADSVPMMNAFREVVNEKGFDEYLHKTLDRISAIESLGRTREIVSKDLTLHNGQYHVRYGRDGFIVEAHTKESL